MMYDPELVEVIEEYEVSKKEVIITATKQPKLNSINAKYVMEKSLFKPRNFFKTASQTVVGMSNVKWQLKMPCYQEGYNSYYWGINLNITTDIPLKYQVSFEISSQNDSIIQHFHDVIDGSKSIGIEKFVTQNDISAKFNKDTILALSIRGTFSYINEEQEQIYGETKMIQNIEWSKRLQNHDQKDFKFVVGNESVEIHKFFLTLESSVITTMLENPNFKETQTGEMIITDFKLNTIKAVVAFCYGEDISEFMKLTKNAIELLKFADKYNMENLKNSFKEYYSKKLTKFNVANILVFANKFNAHELKILCMDFIQTLPKFEQIAIVDGGLTGCPKIKFAELVILEQ